MLETVAIIVAIAGIAAAFLWSWRQAWRVNREGNRRWEAKGRPPGRDVFVDDGENDGAGDHVFEIHTDGTMSREPLLPDERTAADAVREILESRGEPEGPTR